LYTGLSGDIGLVERHQQLGYCMVGLLLFRMAWGIWGGRYARFREYRFSPGRIVGHFLPHSLPPSREAQGEPSATAHTAPGAAIAIVFILLAVAQASTGLFATDDIFTEGPLTRYVDDATASNMTWIHHRVFWLIVVAMAVHLAAHIVYGLRGDSTPLAMFTGRKAVKVEPTQSRLLAGMLTAAVAAGLVWTFLAYV
jgi:cytochrome b